MKKIGRQVLFIGTEKNNPRNGEGAFIKLKNDGIMYAYTEYIGNSWHDHANARISAVFSYDDGETWNDKKVIYEKNPEDMNLMSVSLVRLNDGNIGLFFLKKFRVKENICCKMHLVRISDEGECLSEVVCCIERDGYFVTNNDRVIRLSDGRLMFPANLHCWSEDGEPVGVCKECFFYVSEDDGYTWKIAGESEKCYFADCGTNTGLQENGVYQKHNGRIITWSRTDLGAQYLSISDDGGKSWSAPMPNRFFTSPDSPMQIKNVGKYTVAIFNPKPNYNSRDLAGTWGRTPYVMAVSDDDGDNFTKVFYIEDDETNGYCYPAVIEGDDYMLLAYYHSNDSGVCLNSAKIVKIMYSEFE